MPSSKNLSRRSFLKISFFSSLLTILPFISSCDTNTVSGEIGQESKFNSELSKLAKTSVQQDSEGQYKISKDYIYKTGRYHYVLITEKKSNVTAMKFQQVNLLKKEGNYLWVDGIEDNSSLVIKPKQTINELNRIDNIALKESFLAGSK